MAYSGNINNYLGHGLLSARPAALNIHPSALGVFLATDTDQLFLWHSTSWTEFTDGGAIDWGNVGGTLANQTDLADALGKKVNTEAGKGLSTNDFTSTLKTKLDGVAAGSTANATDSALRDRTTHTGLQAISTVNGLQSALDGKAADTAVVKTAGDQNVAGQKTFTDRLRVVSSLNSALTLEANLAVGGIPQAFTLTAADTASPNRVSAQLIRFIYNRGGTSTVSAFDSLFVTTPQFFTDAAYQLRGFTFEGPVMTAGKTLGSYIAIKIQAPSGAGTVGAKTAIEVDANAGPVLISALGNGVDLFRCGGPGRLDMLSLGSFTLAALPSAAAYNGYYITVSNAAGGPKLCYSNGANWLLVNTSTIVS